jgi:phage N-6-adenine-methyltransferase
MSVRDSPLMTESPPTLFEPNPQVRQMSASQRRNEGRWRGSGRDWATPLDLFEELDREFTFDLDPCASERTAKCLHYFTERENGLNQDWGLNRVFMNPPYGRELPEWVKKARAAAKAGALVVGLLPAATDSAWWHEHVMGNAEVRYLRKRPKFLIYTDTGVKWNSPFQPCVVVIWKRG